jgi:phosphoribosyl 1,2-cyclic phosphodiesterase
VKVTLWGTRGSQAAPGPETVRYGGNTSTVEIEVDARSRVVLDAGTGLRRFGAMLPAAVRRVDVLLTHLHMDHIQGLGFFEPLFRPDFEVHIWGPGSATAELRQRLTRYMSPPLFPVRLPELPCALQIHDLRAGPIAVRGLTVHTALVCHPGPTVAYRIETADASLAYIPDHEPVLACKAFATSPQWCSGFDLANDVDLLIHDAQYDDNEYRKRIGWGHSTLRHAVDFAHVTNATQLMPFHYDPSHDDHMLDAAFAKTASDTVPIVPAREGETFHVGSRGGGPASPRMGAPANG